MADIASTATITAIRLQEQGSDPAAPASGHQVIYVKTGGLYVENAAGTVTGPLGTGGGGGGAADDFVYWMA